MCEHVRRVPESQSNERAVFEGGCHCGAIRVQFAPSVAPDDLPLRECACTFCRRHGATTATDRDGRLHVTLVKVEEAVRYRFGARTADFLLCGTCGVYVAAVMSTEAGAVSTLNINVLDQCGLFSSKPEPVSYEDESPHQRRLRRAERWTITTVDVVKS